MMSALVLSSLLFGCTSSSQPPPSVSVSGVQPAATEVTIRRTDFQIRYVLDGTSVESRSIPLISNRELSFVPAPTLANVADQRVRAGQVLGRSVVDPAVRETLSARGPGSSVDAAELSQLRALRGRVVAPADGVLRLVTGEPVIESSGVDAVVDLLPIQYLRYRSLRFSGRAFVETVLGARAVPCIAIWISLGDGGASTYTLHCRLPGYVETAAGLPTRLTLTSARWRDVVVVPNVYIRYDRAAGSYFIVATVDGEKRKILVSVGPTDGVARVVTSAVPVGATLLAPEGG